MHEGHLRVIHVGLHNVVLRPTDPAVQAETVSLQELCEMGDPDEDDDEDWRRRRLRVVDLPMYETPRSVWCALADSGASTNKFMLAAWVPALMVSTWSTTRTLLPLLPQVAPLFEKADALGLTGRVADIAVTALWSLYWLLILVAVMMCGPTRDERPPHPRRARRRPARPSAERALARGVAAGTRLTLRRRSG
eukprot:7370459-Prymnesium_polylepis.1